MLRIKSGETVVSALDNHSFIYVVYADNLLYAWLTDQICLALNGFTCSTTFGTV